MAPPASPSAPVLAPPLDLPAPPAPPSATAPADAGRDR
jgi:hypothetical protein